MPGNQREQEHRAGQGRWLLLLLLLLLSLNHHVLTQESEDDIADSFQVAHEFEIRGVNMANEGRLKEAMKEFRSALKLLEKRKAETKVTRARIHHFIGNLYTLQGDLPRGLQEWLKAVKLDPNLTDARMNVIKSLSDQGRHGEALKHAQEANARQAPRAEMLVMEGDACKALRNFTCAKLAYSKALRVNPNSFSAHFQLAVAHRDLMEDVPALRHFERAAEIDPSSSAVVNALAVVRGDTCKWGEPDFSVPSPSNLLSLFATRDIDEKASPIHPLLLAYHLDNATLLRIVVDSQARGTAREAAVSVGHAAIDQRTNRPDPRARPRKMFSYKKAMSLFRGENKRLRVGYLTADIHDHPTALLVQGMFRQHQQTKEIEVFMFSYGPNDGSLYRRMIQDECEHFHDLEGEPFLQIATRINQEAVHILVDMKQHTESHALNVLSLHPAPLQIAWLGFPGGVGGGLVRYLVSDPIVTPPDSSSFYQEHLALLPLQLTYQINNLKRDPFIGEEEYAEGKRKAKEEEEEGEEQVDVPSGWPVYTSLNHPRKMKPARFSSCMEILKAVEGSKFSILSRHSSTGENLRREAKKRGIDPSRIHIAKVLNKKYHLLRFKASTLFLDTFPYGAHTTATEALYAGLPILTRPGESFASRVVASLLAGLGREETCVRTEEEFVKLGIILGKNGRSWNTTKTRLVSSKRSSVLFREGEWVRHFQRLLKILWELEEAGEKHVKIHYEEPSSSSSSSSSPSSSSTSSSSSSSTLPSSPSPPSRGPEATDGGALASFYRKQLDQELREARRTLSQLNTLLGEEGVVQLGEEGVYKLGKEGVKELGRVLASSLDFVDEIQTRLLRAQHACRQLEKS